MDYVFLALERKFKADGWLSQRGRKLYNGLLEGEVRNVKEYAEVGCENIDHSMDSFGKDEPVYTLRFRLHSKHGRPEPCGTFMRNMRRVYHEQDLASEHFDVAGMRFEAESGPDWTDDHWVGEMTMELHVCLKTRLAALQERV